MSWLSSVVGKIPGVGGLLNDAGKVVDGVGNGIIGAIPGGSAILGGVDAIGRMIPSPGGGAAGAAGGLGLAQLLGIANAAQLQGKSNTYAGQALSQAQGAYDAKAPLRAAGIAGMQYTPARGNPFAQGFTSAPAGLPVAGITPSGASPVPGRPSVVHPTAGQPSAPPSGSALASTQAPSVGQASTPPNPGAVGTPPALRVATTPGLGTPPKGLPVANAIELQKLFA